jgi:hypothetical protein
MKLLFFLRLQIFTKGMFVNGYHLKYIYIEFLHRARFLTKRAEIMKHANNTRVRFCFFIFLLLFSVCS